MRVRFHEATVVPPACPSMPQMGPRSQLPRLRTDALLVWVWGESQLRIEPRSNRQPVPGRCSDPNGSENLSRQEEPEPEKMIGTTESEHGRNYPDRKSDGSETPRSPLPGHASRSKLHGRPLKYVQKSPDTGSEANDGEEQDRDPEDLHAIKQYV